MDLWEYFNNNEGKKITKWSHYFPVYEKHFAPLRDKPIKLLEIGVLNGGSLEMWRKYFHPDSVIVGIDINPDCKNHEQEGINIRIGDQSDPVFLKSLIDEFGAFDLVLDDASHHVDHVNKTFQFLYPLIDKDGMYFIEDTHAAYWQSHGGGLNVPESINNISKNLVDELNADHTNGQIPPTDFTRSTTSITFYDSIIIFQKGAIVNKRPMEIGGPKSDEILVIRTD
ncbi:MAG: hypothetical protein ACO28V_06525 [Chitinophagaceae bacterium]